MIAGCAAPQAHIGAATHFGGKVDATSGSPPGRSPRSTRTTMPLAIDLAERAVAKTPSDAGFRALLGNAYFAGGRFRSAEVAYQRFADASIRTSRRSC